MKSRFLKVGVCILIFFSLICASNLLFRPVYERLGKTFEGVLVFLGEKARDEFGLEISYENISPSILRGIRVTGISISDSKTRAPVASVRSASVSYSIPALLKGDFSRALKHVSLRDVDISIAEGKNDFWIEKISEFAKKKSSFDAGDSFEISDGFLEKSHENFGQGVSTSDKISEALEGIDVSFLRDLRIYRMRARYEKGDSVFSGEVSRATFLNADGGHTDARLRGNFEIEISGRKILGDMGFSASIPNSLDGSNAVLRIANITAEGCRVRYLGFLAEYRDKMFSLKMLPNSQDIYAELVASLENGDASAKFFADNFNVAKMVQTSSQSQIAKSVFAMNFSISAETDFNINSKKFSYSSNGNVFIPARAFPREEFSSDILVSYSVSGDEEKISVPDFRVSGERYNLSFSGGFNFKKIEPFGNLYVDSFMLPNGGVISTEVYFEPQAEGFMCFSPQVNLGENTLTAAMLNVIPSEDSWDFTFEVSDYSHVAAERPGLFSLYGSFSPNANAFQASASLDMVYLDSMTMLYSFFAERAMRPLLERVAAALNPFVFSCEAFTSSEDGEYSFNVPYAFIANTVRDDQMLMLSADGNREIINLERLEVTFAKQRLLMDAQSVLLGEGGDRSIVGRLELNEIPYIFTGRLAENWISIDSEYGFRFSMNTDTSGEEAVLTGLFSVEEFPLQIGGHSFSLTNETDFSYALSNGPNVIIPRFEARLIDSESTLRPAVSFSANVDSTGAIFRNLSYSDSVSNLTGEGSVFVLAQNRKFEEASFLFSLSDLLGREHVSLSGEISNLMRNVSEKDSSEKSAESSQEIFSDEISETSESLSLEEIPESPRQTQIEGYSENAKNGGTIENLFVDAALEISSLRSQRFVRSSRDSDTVNASLSVRGMLLNPSVSLSVPAANFTVQNTPFVVKAQGLLEDKKISLGDASVDFGATQIEKIAAEFDFNKFEGEMNFDFKSEILGSKFSSEVSARASALSEIENGIPAVMNFSLDAGAIVKNGVRKFAPYHLEVTKAGDELLISSSENIGLSGTVSHLRDISLRMKNPLPLRFSVDGSVSPDDVNLIFSDVFVGLPKLLDGLNVDVVKVRKGNLSGGFSITGTTRNPYFAGALEIVPAEFSCPDFFRRPATTEKITLFMSEQEFYTEPTRCMLRRQPVDVTVNVQMNGFAFESLGVHVQTIEERFVPLNMNLSEIHVKGDFLANLDILYEDGRTSVSGELVAKDTNAEFGATRLNEIFAGFAQPFHNDDDETSNTDVALNIRTESRVQISYSSYLRAVVVPGSEIEVTYFGDQNRLLLDGIVPIRSGELSYLNTNFYIKEGVVHFSDNDESFDPRITVRAETKTRDENGDNVTVSLSVDNQHLSELSPRLSASPAKSEREIMEILGTIITADSSNIADFALAYGDQTIQTVFTRKLENALRDFFNFDIFSLRTMVVQNAVKQGIGRSSSGEGQGSFSNPAGNYLDGTTVYIGKYLGDSMFVDAMLRMDYDENRTGDKYTLNGLSFRPEIGFELESPFANVRWSIAPDFEDLVNLRLVQNTALTLSWKFNF
ncbi:MAG: translocation/assembly module TamB [Treponemataceae bacterium]|nr:translocation/assembly module TamB [Treponemataceae bacterium]